MNDSLFRPSSMLRRSKCPGSLALESTLPVADDENEYQEQGTRLHALVADPSLPRDGCSPSELELIETVEKAEKEFLEKIFAAQVPLGGDSRVQERGSTGTLHPAN